jgi:hypothetical protein
MFCPFDSFVTLVLEEYIIDDLLDSLVSINSGTTRVKLLKTTEILVSGVTILNPSTYAARES